MDNRPLIQQFELYGNFYLYDTNKNSIVKVDDKAYEQLSKLVAGEAVIDEMEDSDPGISTIKKLKSEGFLSSKRIKEIISPFDDMLFHYTDNKVTSLNLQVTQQCNFRCEYCIYSGEYKTRAHSNKKMTLDTARKGIDFLLKHSKDAESINLGFYGGEPLLAFDLVRDCILYIEKEAEGKEIRYSLTTNGSLINKEIMDFFSEHNVNLTLSLDGPKEIHDKHRRFASNNMGSFDIIQKKLKFVKDNYPDYFKGNMLINTVIDPENDYESIDQFFGNNEQVKAIPMTSGFISADYKDNEPTRIPEETRAYHEYQLFCIFWDHLKKGKNGDSKLVQSDYSRLLTDAELLEASKELPDRFHHGGPCIPGVQRLFLNVEGNFYPCERVSETSESMRIGNLDQGFDLDKIREILNIGKLTEEHCKSCWAIRLCSMCALKADTGDGLSQELKLRNCVLEKDGIENMLKDYTALKELGFDFSDTYGLTEFDLQRSI